MTNKLSVAFAVSVALALSASFAACGSSSGGSSQSQATDSTSVPAAETTTPINPEKRLGVEKLKREAKTSQRIAAQAIHNKGSPADRPYTESLIDIGTTNASAALRHQYLRAAETASPDPPISP